MTAEERLRHFLTGNGDTLFLSRREAAELVRELDKVEIIRQESKRFRTIVNRLLGDGPER